MPIEQLRDLLNSYYLGKTQVKFNPYSADPYQFAFTTEGAAEWNKLFKALRSSDLKPLRRTKSGSISTAYGNLINNRYAYDVRCTAYGAVLTVCLGNRIYIFKIGKVATKVGDDQDLYPNQAFNIFYEKCLDCGIDLELYAIDNGAEVKKEIKRPFISMKYHHTAEDEWLDNVHHIDFHNSYPAGLCNRYPEFRKVVEPIYEARKTNPVNKAILNYTIGWFQSYKPESGRFARWANLSRDAIEDNNNRVAELSLRLQIKGREIIGYNTDGIWYRGEIYHGPGEGSNLGEWSNDHHDCKFRSKSNGCYEFIEDGIYYPVVRGCTELDKIEPDRTKWKPGDIFRSEVYGFYFDEQEGVVLE